MSSFQIIVYFYVSNNISSIFPLLINFQISQKLKSSQQPPFMSCHHKHQQKDNSQLFCTFETYAYLQQQQTLDQLRYLKIQQQDEKRWRKFINFNSQTNDLVKNNKKNKSFYFDDVYHHNCQIKYQCSNIITSVVNNVLAGQNQSLLIYGTEQKWKDKIIIGQYQNPGLYLCILSYLFSQCHQRQLQDLITIKFSCSLWTHAKFVDVFSGNQSDNCFQFIKDYLQGGIVHAIPQIIIRNVRTGVKLLNIAMKQITEQRQKNLTQNIIFTLKIQLGNKNSAQIYNISKINIIKFGNPSINNSLKGINKYNRWFINLFNYIQPLHNTIQQTTIDQNNIDENIQIQKQNTDQFITTIQQTCFKYSHRIIGFISINNKMNSNQCLTALLFGSYLKTLKINPVKFIINCQQINKQRLTLFNSIFNNVIIKSQKISIIWLQYIQHLQNYMNQFNYLQFQYSITIGQACQKLNKYIKTQQIEQYYKTKKISIQKNEDLIKAYIKIKKQKEIIYNYHKKISVQINNKIHKNQIQKYFDIEFSMVHHFLIDNFNQIKNIIHDHFSKIYSSCSDENKSKFNIINQQDTFCNKKIVKVSPPQSQNYRSNSRITQVSGINKPSIRNSITNENNKKSYAGYPIDNLQSMFKNKNIGRGFRSVEAGNKKNKTQF